MQDDIKFGFPASGISAAAGRHKYRDRYEALAEIFHRYNSHHLPTTAQKRHLPREYVHKVIMDMDEKLPVVSVRTQHDKDAEKDIKETLAKKVKECVLKISGQRAAKDAITYSERILDMNRGTYLEDETIEKINKIGHYKVEKVNTCFRKKFGYKNRHTVFGRVDGVILDGKTIKAVVEIKNRKDRFFMPVYDLDQLASYVFMTGAQEGVFVQQLEGELNITVYDREDLMERWAMIEADLKKTIKFARKIVKYPEGPEWKLLKEMFIFSDD